MTAVFDEHLVVVDGRDGDRLECRVCGEDVCRTDQNYKRHLLQEVTPVEEANPNLVDPAKYVDPDMEFRRYYCPGCATQVTTDIMLADREPIADKQLD